MWMAKRMVLIIQPQKSDIEVHAVLAHNGPSIFRNGVQVHYGGNPNEEVLLVGEANPGYYALGEFFFPFEILLMHWIHCLFSKQRGARNVTRPPLWRDQ